MRILCPFCGERTSAEFACRGEAPPVRPNAGEAIGGLIYLRDNPAGPIEEHWYHTQGCRQWLIVTRDTLTHEISRVRLARTPA